MNELICATIRLCSLFYTRIHSTSDQLGDRLELAVLSWYTTHFQASQWTDCIVKPLDGCALGALLGLLLSNADGMDDASSVGALLGSLLGALFGSDDGMDEANAVCAELSVLLGDADGMDDVD